MVWLPLAKMKLRELEKPNVAGCPQSVECMSGIDYDSRAWKDADVVQPEAEKTRGNDRKCWRNGRVSEFEVWVFLTELEDGWLNDEKGWRSCCTDGGITFEDSDSQVVAGGLRLDKVDLDDVYVGDEDTGDVKVNDVNTDDAKLHEGNVDDVVEVDIDVNDVYVVDDVNVDSYIVHVGLHVGFHGLHHWNKNRNLMGSIQCWTAGCSTRGLMRGLKSLQLSGHFLQGDNERQWVKWWLLPQQLLLKLPQFLELNSNHHCWEYLRF